MKYIEVIGKAIFAVAIIVVVVFVGVKYEWKSGSPQQVSDEAIALNNDDPFVLQNNDDGKSFFEEDFEFSLSGDVKLNARIQTIDSILNYMNEGLYAHYTECLGSTYYTTSLLNFGNTCAAIKKIITKCNNDHPINTFKTLNNSVQNVLLPAGMQLRINQTINNLIQAINNITLKNVPVDCVGTVDQIQTNLINELHRYKDEILGSFGNQSSRQN